MGRRRKRSEREYGVLEIIEGKTFAWRDYDKESSPKAVMMRLWRYVNFLANNGVEPRRRLAMLKQARDLRFKIRCPDDILFRAFYSVVRDGEDLDQVPVDTEFVRVTYDAVTFRKMLERAKAAREVERPSGMKKLMSVKSRIKRLQRGRNGGKISDGGGAGGEKAPDGCEREAEA